jgi:hypothetical protein
LGIIVDDTVHFLAKYLRARREEGMNAPGAVRYAFNTVGVAILLTTVILTFGFGFLSTSTFAINAQMGLLTSIAIGVALVFDFTILPILLIFDHPADIDGTALLSHAHILEADDQWLFLPALKRVKRISSVNKSGPFVGSEFAFEDFTALELNKFEYTYLRSEELDGSMCDVVERTPGYEHSGYTKQIAWTDQEVFQVRQVEFYDRRGDLFKTLILSEYKEYEGGIWRAQKLSMTNRRTGKSTDLLYKDYKFKTGLTGKDFEKGVLTRLR